jgi:hypothetical protein
MASQSAKWRSGFAIALFRFLVGLRGFRVRCARGRDRTALFSSNVLEVERFSCAADAANISKYGASLDSEAIKEATFGRRSLS